MNIVELKTKISKSTDFFKSELAQIRTGRATPSLVENIIVEAYEAKMTIKEVASVTSMDTQNLVITPWDKNLLKDISKALNQSDLKINPIIDGDRLRVPFPSLPEDRRKELVKIVSLKVEECKNAIRNLRQEAMKDIEADFNNKLFGEDEKFSKKDDVEKMVKEFTNQVDSTGEDKKTELMKV